MHYSQVKRDSEQLQIIREIQKSITEWNMPPGLELKDYGRLRKDSELKVGGVYWARKYYFPLVA